jgi:hypothetical protein
MNRIHSNLSATSLEDDEKIRIHPAEARARIPMLKPLIVSRVCRDCGLMEI